MIVAHRRQLDALAFELLEREVLERDSIERIMAGVPRLERAPGVGLRVVAAAATAADAVSARINCGACSAASTTSASPSSRSSRRSSSIATASSCASPTARWWRSRASRPCCWTSARTTSSCWRRSAPRRRSGRFLAKHGPGLHHVAYQVEDIDATLGALKQAGLELIDEQPRAGIRGSRVAFMHPRATAGVLTEIVEPAAGLEDH